jgi:ABC-2 type transport system ATP-binding protein
VGVLERGRLLVSGPIADISERLSAGRRLEAQAPEAVAPFAPGLEAVPAPEYLTPGGAPLPLAARRRLKLRVLGDSRHVLPLLQGGGGVLEVEAAPGGLLSVLYTGDERFVADVVRHLVSSGVPVVGVEPERNELERIFLEVTRGELG